MNASRTEHRASRVLQFGVWASAILMTFGLILAFVRGFSPEESTGGISFEKFVGMAGADPFNPVTLLSAGLLMLMCTPVLRVVTALIGFTAERDRRFALVSSIVLLLLISEICYSIIMK